MDPDDLVENMLMNKFKPINEKDEQAKEGIVSDVYSRLEKVDDEWKGAHDRCVSTITPVLIPGCDYRNSAKLAGLLQTVLHPRFSKLIIVDNPLETMQAAIDEDNDLFPETDIYEPCKISETSDVYNYFRKLLNRGTGWQQIYIIISEMMLFDKDALDRLIFWHEKYAEAGVVFILCSASSRRILSRYYDISGIPERTPDQETAILEELRNELNMTGYHSERASSAAEVLGNISYEDAEQLISEFGEDEPETDEIIEKRLKRPEEPIKPQIPQLTSPGKKPQMKTPRNKPEPLQTETPETVAFFAKAGRKIAGGIKNGTKSLVKWIKDDGEAAQIALRSGAVLFLAAVIISLLFLIGFLVIPMIMLIEHEVPGLAIFFRVVIGAVIIGVVISDVKKTNEEKARCESENRKNHEAYQQQCLQYDQQCEKYRAEYEKAAAKYENECNKCKEKYEKEMAEYEARLDKYNKDLELYHERMKQYRSRQTDQNDAAIRFAKSIFERRLQEYKAFINEIKRDDYFEELYIHQIKA